MPTESNEKWQHLSRLLDQVLDLDAQERAEWLESLAKSDPEMAEMVSAALAAKEREGFAGFLAGSAIDLEGIGESTLAGAKLDPMSSMQKLAAVGWAAFGGHIEPMVSTRASSPSSSSTRPGSAARENSAFASREIFLAGSFSVSFPRLHMLTVISSFIATSSRATYLSRVAARSSCWISGSSPRLQFLGGRAE